MRALDCDFCGGTAGGAYEVLPEGLDPAPDEQVRLVLCDSCRRTLDGVVAPLLDRLDAGGAGNTDSSFAADAAGQGSPADDENDKGGEDDEGTAETGEDSGFGIDTAGHDSPSPAELDLSAADDDHGETDGAHTVVEDDAADATDDAADRTDGPGDDRGGAAATREDDPDATGTDADEEPAEFRTVMRFLNNREFPVDRAEVAEFAAGAYDLEDEEVREIFDYAIERGVLVEDDGQLSKG
ncbi:hypothetical protein GRX01_16095 [Halobaculum sp. WSA2]|uniref:Uncharacterized protein n=1 Tax=Halobaculum saliterrae TaxID=2073113 RepID=A0A6B0SW22_9EURY|nr:hypothetical protein [Halobaculum saliterrae]MXR42855.1 hypothetical protein [Halobaculum saliterrae]